jgi:hypothetical protein
LAGLKPAPPSTIVWLANEPVNQRSWATGDILCLGCGFCAILQKYKTEIKREKGYPL